MSSTVSAPRVLIDSVWTGERGLARDVMLVVGGALVIVAAAQVRLPLPFTPVPLTGQTFAVLLIGALFGAKRGAASAMTYIMLGLMGLPVFSAAPPGPAALFSPTAGYLAGFVGAAWVTGSLAERGWDRKPWTAALAMLIGSTVIFACGLLWLGRYVGWNNVVQQGLLPFIPGDVIKIALATVLLPAGWKLLGSRKSTRD
jgi:biotin transport system substrate-specific component